jgi:hypothetical protein
MLISVLDVLVYVGFHTLILFVHVATLNVAMNLADQALHVHLGLIRDGSGPIFHALFARLLFGVVVDGGTVMTMMTTTKRNQHGNYW